MSWISLETNYFEGLGMAKKHSATTEITRSGITMGSALAMILSYSANQSILWAILHGIFSWFYVIYFAIVH